MDEALIKVDKVRLKPVVKIHAFYESIFHDNSNNVFSKTNIPMTSTLALSNKKSPITHLWTRLTTARWEDVWVERLRCAGPEALVIKAFPASQTLRLQVYTTKAMASRLQKAWMRSRVRLNTSSGLPKAHAASMGA